MKAIYFEQHGGPEVLQYGERPTPQPAPGWVRVKLSAAALNHADLFVRAGWPGIKLSLPHILGADGAGVVDALGEGVTRWQPGQRVVINASICMEEDEFTQRGEENKCRHWELLGESLPGTYAEYVCVPASNLLEIPGSFPAAHAAAAALVYVTAWHSIVRRGALQKGETLLIVGASGGVNTASIQIGKYLGLRVIVVGSDESKLALARQLGADEVIDRSQGDWSKAAYLLTEKRGVDAVVDNVGITFMQSLRTLRKGGRLLTVGNTGAPTFEIDNRYIFSKHLSILGSTMGTFKDFADVMALVFAGELKPVVDRSYPLAEARAAHARMEAGGQMGKIVLEFE
ncbi:MAG: zinc-binding dehydrogenase [Anaerolineales bacterium]|jgi:NADPH:quinone reductase-like Zn-dependent oxidoreductase|nr:zinc-binding dehydrogenase [Anaerolineales bacterium]MCW5887346.1 zinc-binding dehydrogenase [Anaerolineales bacterium]